MEIEVKLTDKEKMKYKKMSIEEIMEDVKTRCNPPKQDLINCAVWIKEESQLCA